MWIDLHVHTVRGSSDSSLAIEELLAEARRLGLEGICLTEHAGGWTQRELTELSNASGVVLFSAVEVETDFGHVQVIGGAGQSRKRHLQALRHEAKSDGTALVFAHPFRHYQDKVPGNPCLLTSNLGWNPKDAEEASTSWVWNVVHAIETVNAATSEADNRFAHAVATRLGLGTTGGSDAHSLHGVGTGLTWVEGNPRTNRELAELIRGGHACGAVGPPARHAHASMDRRDHIYP